MLRGPGQQGPPRGDSRPSFIRLNITIAQSVAPLGSHSSVLCNHGCSDRALSISEKGDNITQTSCFMLLLVVIGSFTFWNKLVSCIVLLDREVSLPCHSGSSMSLALVAVATCGSQKHVMAQWERRALQKQRPM